MKHSSIWTSNTGRDVRAVARGPGMSGRSAVLTPFPALPWESHACCNNVATDFIPLPPEALYPQSALVSKTDNLTVLNLFKGFLGSWKVCNDDKLIIPMSMSVFRWFRVVQKKHFSFQTFVSSRFDGFYCVKRLLSPAACVWCPTGACLQ